LPEEAFEDPNKFTTEDYVDDSGEMRYQTIAAVEDKLFLIVFVDRLVDGVEMPRVISLRKATKYEQQTYRFHAR